jgi:hypothetical protein
MKIMPRFYPVRCVVCSRIVGLSLVETKVYCFDCYQKIRKNFYSPPYEISQKDLEAFT